MKKLLKSKICETHALFIAEKSKHAVRKKKEKKRKCGSSYGYLVSSFYIFITKFS